MNSTELLEKLYGETVSIEYIDDLTNKRKKATATLNPKFYQNKTSETGGKKPKGSMPVWRGVTVWNLDSPSGWVTFRLKSITKVNNKSLNGVRYSR